MSTALLSPIAAPVREVLSGRRDGQSDIARQIAEGPGEPGWFTPDHDIWRVHGSVATFLGGIRALLLQALHPLALAGVNQHSRYRSDPFGRLQRTGAFIAATTFGSEQLAERTVRAISSMHGRVVGTAPDGRAYSAQDPRLLTWVHVTLTDSMLTSYLRFGHDGPISPDGYVSDMAVVGAAMGVPDPPRSVAQLRARLVSFNPDLERTAESDAMRDFVVTPPLPRGLRPGYAVLARAARNTLAPGHRALLGDPIRAQWRERAENRTADGTLRVLRAALVKSPARAAGERRLAGG